MNEMRFVIPRQSKAIQSVRTARGIHYQPKSNTDYKALISIIALNTMKEQGWELLTCPIVMQIIDIRKLPKSRRKAERKAVEEGELLLRPNIPDWDNIAKGTGDALNGIAYNDDRQIVDGMVHKRWGRADEIIILIRPATQDTLYALLSRGGFA